MIYEYKFVELELSQGQKEAAQLGMILNIDELNKQMATLINKEATDGWEPLYPFSSPSVWFKREKKKRIKSK